MRHTILTAWLIVAFAAPYSTVVRADRIAVPASTPKTYTQECSACHMAYPPGLLPASTWKRILGSLDKHYGTDASLDDKAVTELTSWLQANAGTYKRAVDTPDARITSAAWFVRKHREITPATWKLRSVGGAFNCTACHSGAAQGDFSERNLRMPK